LLTCEKRIGRIAQGQLRKRRHTPRCSLTDCTLRGAVAPFTADVASRTESHAPEGAFHFLGLGRHEYFYGSVAQKTIRRRQRLDAAVQSLAQCLFNAGCRFTGADGRGWVGSGRTGCPVRSGHLAKGIALCK